MVVLPIKKMMKEVENPAMLFGQIQTQNLEKQGNQEMIFELV